LYDYIIQFNKPVTNVPVVSIKMNDSNSWTGISELFARVQQ